MPYGYKEYRESKNISPNTTVHEVQTINSLIAFVNSKYKKHVAPHEIRPIDIEEFLNSEREKNLQDSTVHRKLRSIKRWYEYLWEIGKVPVDFMPKFKYADNLDTKSNKLITLNYEELLSKKPNFLKASNVMIVTKLFFIFYMKGIRLRDIIKIDVENIIDAGDDMRVVIEKQNDNQLFELTFTEPEEIGVLLSGIERALFRNTNYLFSSKATSGYDIFRLGSMKDYQAEMNEYFGKPIRTEELRYAYVHYLFKVKHHTVEEITEILGISLANTVSLLKESLERMPGVVYNVERIEN